jgi:hypothetical protein
LNNKKTADLQDAFDLRSKVAGVPGNWFKPRKIASRMNHKECNRVKEMAEVFSDVAERIDLAQREGAVFRSNKRKNVEEAQKYKKQKRGLC